MIWVITIIILCTIGGVFSAILSSDFCMPEDIFMCGTLGLLAGIIISFIISLLIGVAEEINTPPAETEIYNLKPLHDEIYIESFSTGNSYAFLIEDEISVSVIECKPTTIVEIDTDTPVVKIERFKNTTKYIFTIPIGGLERKKYAPSETT